MEPLKVWIVSSPEKKRRALLFSVDLLCRSSHEVRWSADKNGGSVAGGKTSSSCIILFPNYLKRRIFANLFVINKLQFLGQIFLLGNVEFTKRLFPLEWTGVVNNLSSTKLSYSKWKNAVLNSSKYFLALKKVNPRILLTFKRSFSKNNGKNTELTHYPLARRWILLSSAR